MSNSQTDVGPRPPRSAVLIVEDERVARRALSALLAYHGFETAVAASAEEALAIVSRFHGQSPRRVALVDFNLPGMNGLEFISQLERIDPAAMPVLMTASCEETVGEAVRDRHLAYLPKPLDLAQLLNVISHTDEPS